MKVVNSVVQMCGNGWVMCKIYRAAENLLHGCSHRKKGDYIYLRQNLFKCNPIYLYQVLMSKKCPVCESGKKKEIEKLINDNISRRVIAAQYGMTLEEINVHIEFHMDNGHTAVLVDYTGVPIVDIVTENMTKIASRLKVILDNTEADDYAANKQIKMLMSEVRNASINIAQLKGQLVQEQHVTIVQFNQLKAVILTELCPACREKVMKRLEEDVIDVKQGTF